MDTDYMNTRPQKIRKLTFVSALLSSMLIVGISSLAYAATDKDAQATVQAAKEAVTEAESKGTNNDQLEEIIVTGTRTGRARDKIPGAVSVISQQDIRNNLNLSADITAVLERTVPGYGQSKQQMDRRGETLRGRVALRLLDGVPQGSPLRDGSRDSIFTDMGIVSRIEVINGPSASEGIGASGGIINYITKTPDQIGTELTFSTQLRSQFHDGSSSWRVAFNAAHKTENNDILVAASFSETGIAYSGDGNTIGIGTSGSDRDSKSNNLFVKLGTNFGTDNSQRLELSHARFRLECQCRYSLFIVNNDFGYQFDHKIPYTSVRKPPDGDRASFNDFVQSTLAYTNDKFFGGSLAVQIYRADQAMRFQSERTFSKQDPLFKPFDLGPDGFPVSSAAFTPLAEQSEINSAKKGLRSSWSGEGLFGYQGLGLQIGADVVEDTAEQRLAIQKSVWVPPMKYTSFAPFAQVSFDVGAWTFTAGERHEDGKLKVADYVTSWANDRRPVGGGTINYGQWLPNFGAIWRINDQWSSYISYSKGFTLPNAGIPLRNIRCSNDTSERGDPNDPINKPFGGIQPDGCPNDPPISVNDIIDLEAIVVDNKEFGFSWKGEAGSLGVSLFKSTSNFGATLRVDPAVGDFVLSRKPTNIKGIEVTGAYNLFDSLNLSVIYSHITGKTSNSDPKKLDRTIGVFNIGPDKLVTTANWGYSSKGNVILGATTTIDRNINVGRSGEEHIKGYTLFNLTANYQLGEGILSLGVDNLFDKTYLLATSQVLFYKNYMLGRGREFTLGYTISFLN